MFYIKLICISIPVGFNLNYITIIDAIIEKIVLGNVL